MLEVTLADDSGDPIPVMEEMLGQTAQFTGFETARVLRDFADPLRFVIDISWATADAYDAYLAWRRSPAGSTPLTAILDGPPVIRRFSSSHDLS